MTHTVYIDVESRSEFGLSSKDKRPATVYEYARHHSTDFLSISYAIDEGSLKAVSFRQALHFPGFVVPMPSDLSKALVTPGTIVIAHNAYFERNMWEEIAVKKHHWVPIRPEQWRCSMAVAGYSGLPLGLDDACKMLGIKGKTSQDALHRMMKPNPKWHTDPSAPKWLESDSDWEELLYYNKVDVEIERNLWKRLRVFPKSEKAVWLLDYEINQRGVPFDRELAQACADMTADLTAECEADLVASTEKVLTEHRRALRVHVGSIAGCVVPDDVRGLKALKKTLKAAHVAELELSEDRAALEAEIGKSHPANPYINLLINRKITSPNQTDAIKAYCNFFGVPIPNVQEQTVLDALEETDEDNPAYEVLEIRSVCAGAASGKFRKMLDLMSADGNVRGAYLYYGGRTGRFASRGLQLHNLAKQRMHWSEAEALIPLALARDVEALKMFGKLRHVLASLVRPCICAPEGYMFAVQDYSAIEARMVAWIAEDDELLKLFLSGEDPYVTMAAMIYKIPRSKVTDKQRAFGKAAVLGLGFGMGAKKFLATAKSWGLKVDEALIQRAVDTYRTRFHKVRSFWYALNTGIADALHIPGRTFQVRKIGVKYFKDVDVLRLMLPSGRPLFYHKPRINKDGKFSYLGRLGASEQGSIGRVYAWGGKLTENVVQATARDCLTSSMLKIETAIKWATLMLHTHDEIGCLVKTVDGQKCYDEMGRLMTDLPAWAKGLPVECKGWVGRRYRKD